MDGYDADELTSYTSLSVLAVCALVVALLSTLALMVPLLVVLPLAGILMALLALGRIKAAEGALSGRSLALVAMFLSVALAVASPVRFFVRDAVYKGQADQFARQWLALLAAGEDLTALNHLTNDAVYGLSHTEDAPGPTKSPEPKVIAARLKESPLAVALKSLSEDELRETVTQAIHCEVLAASPQVGIEYLAGQEHPVQFSVTTLRHNLPGKGATWQISSWSLLD
jgi:alkylhydroperoxidase/carboxymuconolactone decarboxylase family protein YurZ